MERHIAPSPSTLDHSLNTANEEEQVFLGIGSNIGDRELMLEQACFRLQTYLSEIRISSVYETKAVDFSDQPDFLNIVLCGRTGCDPLTLLEGFHSIESELGRVRTGVPRFGPRAVDIDLLLYGNLIIDTPQIRVPHPRMTRRRFVLIPLLELDETLTDPESGRKFMQFFAEMPLQGVYYFTLNLYS